jgi:hypothetical protein
MELETMTPPQMRVLRNSIFQAEKNLALVATRHGKDSREYQAALRKLVQYWAVLKMSHGAEDFLAEVTR